MTSRRRHLLPRALTTRDHIIFWVSLGITLSSPFGGRAAVSALRAYFTRVFPKKTPFSPRTLSSALYALRSSSKLIRIDTVNGVTTFTLTKKGVSRKLALDVERMHITPLPHWDGQWRMVLFDIPESLRRARDAFRIKLLSLGFFLFQKSTWICPHPCEEEIDCLAAFLAVRPYVHTLTMRIEDDDLLRRHFHLPRV